MPGRTVDIPLTQLTQAGYANLRLSLPGSDHPVYQGIVLHEAGGLRLAPYGIATVIGSIAAVIAIIFGFASIWWQMLLAVLIGSIVFPVGVTGAILAVTKATPAHQAATAALAQKRNEHDSAEVVQLTVEPDDHGNDVVVAATLPHLDYTWAISNLHRKELRTILTQHEQALAAGDQSTAALPPAQQDPVKEFAALARAAVSLADRTDCDLAGDITQYCTQITGAHQAITATDDFDPGQHTEQVTALSQAHQEALAALQVYTQLPAKMVHTPLASQKTPTEELTATLKTIADQTLSLAHDAVRAHADKLSYLRRLTTEKYHRSALDLPPETL